MNLRQKLYQMFILGTDKEGYKEALKTGLGGIIFFTDDIKTAGQFKSLISEIKSLSFIPPFLSIDQEGGRIERTENIHNGKKYLSAKYAFEKGKDFLKHQTEKIALELKDFGINLNFAPCVDVNTNPKNPIIGERSFSSNPDEVIKSANIVIETYKKHGIIPCIKHFPGHGDANADSHLTLPEINLSLKEMENVHIKPFAMCAKNVPMIMAAHLHCTCFEKELIPASLSRNALSYLRNNINYNGIIISDDMVMKGVSGFNAVDACKRGIIAGLNMFIYRNSGTDTINIIESVYKDAQNNKELAGNINDSYEKIINLKRSFNLLNTSAL